MYPKSTSESFRHIWALVENRVRSCITTRYEQAFHTEDLARQCPHCSRSLHHCQSEVVEILLNQESEPYRHIGLSVQSFSNQCPSCPLGVKSCRWNSFSSWYFADVVVVKCYENGLREDTEQYLVDLPSQQGDRNAELFHHAPRCRLKQPYHTQEDATHRCFMSNVCTS